jgi:hypothetical protein
MTFVKDLKFGKQYEHAILKYLAIGKNIEQFVMPKGKFKPYDILDTSTNIKYEIKSDRFTYTTRNVCIEYQYNNQDSGILTSEAIYYFYFVVNTESTKPYERVYKIPTEDIRKMIQHKLFHKSQKGGDAWKSSFYLFRENLFSQYIISLNE